MNKLSLCMIVKNEEEKIGRCLESVKDIVDEIVIVDTGSSDNTKVIAKNYKAKIYEFGWRDNFSEARNYSLTKSTGDWNLILDADEYVVNNCKGEIKKIISEGLKIGRICRFDQFKYNGEIRQSSVFLSRLIPKGVFYEGKIHEQIISNYPRINTNIKVKHDGYINTNKTARNLPILLKEIGSQPKDPYINYQTAKQYSLMKDFSKANKYYNIAYSYLDNKEYFYPMFIVDFLYNIIETKKYEEGLKIIENEYLNLNFYTDFHFVCGIFFMNLVLSDTKKYISFFYNIEKEYNRCIEIGEMIEYDSVQGTGSYLAYYNLGVFNETLNRIEKAKYFFRKAALLGYKLAEERLEFL